MNNAPPVAFPVGRFFGGRVGLCAVACVGAVGLAVWQSSAQVSSIMVLWAWLFWALCVGVAALAMPWHSLQLGHLFWSGEGWFWQTPQGADYAQESQDAQEAQVSVGLDWGSGLLLWVRLHSGKGAADGPLCCAFVQAAAMPSKWHAFRCAVYSRTKHDSQVAPLLSERH